ncbi:MAG: hypothetical protein EAZ37_02810 [Burkholderiales bacterium]|nr:MAG: hypothetical protein EAZ37_02810 [Burkholderiales bacterium]
MESRLPNSGYHGYRRTKHTSVASPLKTSQLISALRQQIWREEALTLKSPERSRQNNPSVGNT